MKKIKLFTASMLFFGAVAFSSCSKEEPVVPVVTQNAEVETRCVTSTGDFIPCEELKNFEAHVASGAVTRDIYPYEWFPCTASDKYGNPVPGGMCTQQRHGGCANAHTCLPCGNC